MDRASLIFCAGALGLTVAITALAYPFAAIPADVLARAATPQPAEKLGSINVGRGFGEVPVTTLIDHYIASPPAPPAAAASTAPRIHFGGC